MTAPAVVATDEMVALAWVKAVVGEHVPTTLPDASGWADTGFVVVTPVGGATNAYVPVRTPAVTIDAWANNTKSNKARWGRANALAESVYRATYDLNRFQASLSVAGHQVRISSAYPLSEPRRVPDDQQSFARYTFDVVFMWVDA